MNAKSYTLRLPGSLAVNFWLSSREEAERALARLTVGEEGFTGFVLPDFHNAPNATADAQGFVTFHS